MKNMNINRLFAAAGAVVLMLAACGRECKFKTEHISCSENFALDIRSRDSLRVGIDFDFPVAWTNAEALEKMQKTIVSGLFGEDAPTDPQQAAAGFKKRLYKQYRNDNLGILVRYLQTEDTAAAEENWPPMLEWDSYIEGNILPLYENLCSYIIYKYSYTGGAHGIDGQIALVFDLSTGEALSEEDIFTDGFEAAMSVALTAHLKECLNDESYYDMLFVREIAPNGNFYITDSGVTYIYGRYEIGPYSIGITHVTVPWEEITGLLKYSIQNI